MRQLSNFYQFVIALIFAIAAISTGIFTKTWWNIMFGLMALVFAFIFAIDNSQGESIKQYIQRKRSK